MAKLPLNPASWVLISDMIFNNFDFESDGFKLVIRIECIEPDATLFWRGGEWWGRDDHGEFRTQGGRPDPPPWDYDRERCGAVMKFTFERYGEVRYCTGLAASVFEDCWGYDREYGRFCKHHQQRGSLMEEAEKRFKTGAFAQSYETIFQYLPPHKQVIAIELFKSLMEESIYDFEPEAVTRDVDSSAWPDAPDEVEVTFPVPTQHRARGEALWFAALDFVRMQNIHEEQFKVAATEDLAVGEKEFEKETESGHVIEIKDEHHLNLPLSRIQKDYEHHIDFGGVTVDEAGDDEPMERQVWVSEVKPKSAKPEAKTDGPESGFTPREDGDY